MRVVCLALLLLIVASGEVLAHTKSQSFSTWRLQGEDIVVTFQIDARRATLLKALDTTSETGKKRLALHLLETLSVSQSGQVCAPKGVPQPLSSADGYERQELRFQCASAGTWDGVDVRIDAFFPVSAQHVHFARARGTDGGWREFIFSDTERQRAFTALQKGDAAHSGPAFTTYTVLGFEHILEGIDHLAFVAALMLLARNFRQVLILLTGFTLGHSVTLALAALGIIAPNIPLIEALIGFTIAFVAAEVLARQNVSLWQVGLGTTAFLGVMLVTSLSVGGAFGFTVFLGLAVFVLAYAALGENAQTQAWLAPSLTIAFGLVHGAGFANVLNEIGLPTDRFVWALLGFNIGVEIGQVFVAGLLALAWKASASLLSRVQMEHAGQASATVLLALGVFWFVERSI